MERQTFIIMASLLRQIVAGPRTRHPQADLDLCYVTDNIIVTSGPSQAYPQLAYRNPLQQLVNFLDSQHGTDWAIWEFRAEGTGYPDEAVYGRVRHYPFPDHHPPPFRLVPMMMASMRNWLKGGELHVEGDAGGAAVAGGSAGAADARDADGRGSADGKELAGIKESKRVAVVHCKAGKGRSGTVSCSYLIAEEGWTAEDALQRFTQRRMRPQFGAGVTIPSQLRWVGYVDRWTRGGKLYVDRPIEIVELRVVGLRNGVRLDVEGFEDEGKRIVSLHTFDRSERRIVHGDPPDGGGLADAVWDLAGYPAAKAPAQADLAEAANDERPGGGADTAPSTSTKLDLLRKQSTKLIRMASAASIFKGGGGTSTTAAAAAPAAEEGKTPESGGEQQQQQQHRQQSSSASSFVTDEEPGGKSVVFRPKTPIIVPNSDVNISVERRNRARKGMGLTVTTAVGHVWFNAYFEGGGPEKEKDGGRPDTEGVFSIAWEAMDGIKGTSRKGTRALDSLEVVWRVAGSSDGEVVREPAQGDPVPEPEAADWKGGAEAEQRTEDVTGDGNGEEDSHDEEEHGGGKGVEDMTETASMDGVKTSGPGGEELPRR
ncbi:PTPc DSPc [Geosmithia morbida]|uniref:phosphatidylinositol-3,4,5-trisphosphate 3-phosphatase n=1 Tax=Geosmithia morbida TaxID=1094350 RepID=A0A9P5D425_9HYPO|nr:PTPc DSPc [Geosmithia morbida]KAF4123076.1 PTPc DSPc [Geosmithia morbida]